MSRWHVELGCLVRYAGAGMVCTALGFAVIFLTGRLGFAPYAANAAGYGCGLLIGFVFNRKVVFRSRDCVHRQLALYLGAFAVAYGLNLLVLYLLLALHGMPVMAAQAGAAVVYTAAMYLLSRFYTFSAAVPAAGVPVVRRRAVPASVEDAVE